MYLIFFMVCIEPMIKQHRIICWYLDVELLKFIITTFI